MEIRSSKTLCMSPSMSYLAPATVQQATRARREWLFGSSTFNQYPAYRAGESMFTEIHNKMPIGDVLYMIKVPDLPKVVLAILFYVRACEASSRLEAALNSTSMILVPERFSTLHSSCETLESHDSVFHSQIILIFLHPSLCPSLQRPRICLLGTLLQ